MPDVPKSQPQDVCHLCGELAKGYAVIDGKRYCHKGDNPTCYMKAVAGWTGYGERPRIERSSPPTSEEQLLESIVSYRHAGSHTRGTTMGIGPESPLPTCATNPPYAKPRTRTNRPSDD